jgi:chromosomal replication initiator protein
MVAQLDLTLDPWQQVLRRLEPSIGKEEYGLFLSQTHMLHDRDGTLEIAAPSQLAIDEIRERYGNEIRAIKHNLFPGGKEIIFSIAQAPEPQRASKASFVGRYRFDNFVLGPSNHLAYAAARSIADNPTGEYNPLFIYGGPGLGKTHLMHALGQAVKSTRPDAAIICLPTDKFVSDFISSVRNGRMELFRTHYRTADLLLLDDFEIISGKEKTQEEFFHIFNTLYNAQRQMVFTSNKRPEDIRDLDDKLASRLFGGLVAHVEMPDMNTKIAILQKKMEQYHRTLPGDVAAYIAECAQTDVRQLEGYLNRTMAFANSKHSTLDLAIAKAAIGSIVPMQTLTPDTIIGAVAEHYGLTVHELKSKTNAHNISGPRQIAWYLCRELTGTSFPALGKMFRDMHHSTVMHGVEKIRTEMTSNEQVAAAIRSLAQRLA